MADAIANSDTEDRDGDDSQASFTASEAVGLQDTAVHVDDSDVGSDAAIDNYSDADDKESPPDVSFTASEAVQDVLAVNVEESDIGSDCETAETAQQDDNVYDDSDQSESVRFHLITEGSKRGKPLLVDSDGYTYNVKKR